MGPRDPHVFVFFCANIAIFLKGREAGQSEIISKDDDYAELLCPTFESRLVNQVVFVVMEINTFSCLRFLGSYVFHPLFTLHPPELDCR